MDNRKLMKNSCKTLNKCCAIKPIKPYQKGNCQWIKVEEILDILVGLCVKSVPKRVRDGDFLDRIKSC